MAKSNNNHAHCKTYKVKSGDNLSTIAVNHGIKLQTLLSFHGNEWLNKNPDLIHPGDLIHLKDHADSNVTGDVHIHHHYHYH